MNSEGYLTVQVYHHCRHPHYLYYHLYQFSSFLSTPDLVGIINDYSFNNATVIIVQVCMIITLMESKYIIQKGHEIISRYETNPSRIQNDIDIKECKNTRVEASKALQENAGRAWDDPEGRMKVLVKDQLVNDRSNSFSPRVSFHYRP